MTVAAIVNIDDLIDQHPLRPLQIRIIVLCGIVAMLDGFDLIAIGIAAPAMADTLHFGSRQLGLVFSAALLGLMLGAFGLGPVADRYGRKRVLIGATATFGLFTLATSIAATLPQLLLLRFLAGFGLGGAMPSFITLAAEYTQRRHRETVAALLWTGFPIGGVIVGLLASRLIDIAGWQPLFYIGGAVPLAFAIVLLWALPESLAFLIAQGATERQVRRIVMQLAPGCTPPPGLHFVTNARPARGVPVRHLFGEGRTGATLLLWMSYFATFLMLVTNDAWAPTLLREGGLDGRHASVAIAAFAMGSAVGTPLARCFASRVTPGAALVMSLVGAAAALAGLGLAGGSAAEVIALQTVAGLCLGIASSGLIGATTNFYPTAIRSTGVGWAMGFGRFGSFVGPLAIGLLVGVGWHLGQLFAVLGVFGIAVALSVAVARTSWSSRAAGTA